MCSSSQCQKCHKTTWSGCGSHIEYIFKNIPVEKRCFCGYTPEELEQEKKNPKYKIGPVPKGESCIIF